MTEPVRLRLSFEDSNMLSRSKKKEGLSHCWFLLKPQHSTISDLTSNLVNAFLLHRTCPGGIILAMDGFVLPSFESTSILKDKDIVWVKRKGSVTDDNPALLPPSSCGYQTIELPKLLSIEGLQEESPEHLGIDNEEIGGYGTASGEDEDDQFDSGAVCVESKSDGSAKSKKRKASKKLKRPRFEEGLQEETRGHGTASGEDDGDQFGSAAVCVESKSDGSAISKKRKASKKLKSPSQKKIKMSTTENLALIPEVHEEENGRVKEHIHQKLSLAKKDKPSALSSQGNNCSNRDFSKQKNDESGQTSDETRSLQPQDESETKKLPSRSARRKKAKRRWLRAQKLAKAKLDPSPVPEKDEKVPNKDNNCIVSDVYQQSSEASEGEDDVVPVEIRPGHIRFQPLKKDQGADQAVPPNQFPVETFRWNGITSKKKGQKWGKERISSWKQDDYENYSQEWPTVQNAEKEKTSNAVDFEKLTPYTSLPKEGDVIAYRLIELSSSWTPELSSFRVGKISQYDAKSNRISLEPVLDFPFVFEKKTDEDASSVQPDPPLYREDGSLEVEYTSIADVRTVKHANYNLAAAVASTDALVKPTNGSTDKKLADDQTASGSRKGEREGHVPAKENGEVNVWDEINEALNAKKAKLSQENGWTKEESSGTRSWSYRAMRCSALGPTMARLRSQNGL